jgi:hypothetical protein
MRIFYGSSAGRLDVSCERPVEASLDVALAVLADLDTGRGFLGVVLDDRSQLQLLRDRDGVRVELLDSSIPAFDACLADSAFAESLLRAVAVRQDVFAVARAGIYPWEHTSLA